MKNFKELTNKEKLLFFEYFSMSLAGIYAK